jgi:CheY-like chemotaxis protein
MNSSAMNSERSILLVDDDDDDREIFVEAVRKIDPTIHCTCAANGEEALKILVDNLPLKPSLIFLDVNMPRLNGLQVLAEIKKNIALNDIKVIMYSTFFAAEDIKKIKKSGAEDFVQKPVKFENLVDALALILSQ